MRSVEEPTSELLDQTPEPEEPTMAKAHDQLLHEVLLSQVRFNARVVVIAHDLEGLDFKTIAAQEKIPLSRAHARYKSGRSQLQAAYDRYQNDQKAQGLFVMPFTLTQLLAADRTIPALPPEVVSRPWRQGERALARQAPRNALLSLRKRPMLFLVLTFLVGALVGAALCSAFLSRPGPAVVVQPEPVRTASVGRLGPSA